MSLRAYDIVAPLAVYESLRTLRPATRRRLEDVLHHLARQPDLPGDFEANAEDGRIHQVKLATDWMLSYWIDHAACEVRVTNLERLE